MALFRLEQNCTVTSKWAMMQYSPASIRTMTADTISDIIAQVASANPQRCKTSLDRRIIKLIEELGEIAEAFLSVTRVCPKKKTWADVREEAADVLIVAIDIALTLQPNDLAGYVRDNGHRINFGFHQLVWRISRLCADFGECYQSDPVQADEYAAEMVCYAFALNRLLDESYAVRSEVARKIKKWKRKASISTMCH